MLGFINTYFSRYHFVIVVVFVKVCFIEKRGDWFLSHVWESEEETLNSYQNYGEFSPSTDTQTPIKAI